jgi:hypothetical protein
MTPREIVRRTVCFERAERIPYSLQDDYRNDIAGVGMDPSPDARPSAGVDEWGCVWANIGVSRLGRPNGGFIAKGYPDPTPAGHTQEAIDAMCEEFRKLSAAHGSR